MERPAPDSQPWVRYGSGKNRVAGPYMDTNRGVTWRAVTMKKA